MVCSLVSLDKSMAALEQAPGRYCRIYECKCTELVLASDETLYPGPVLDGTVQLLLTYPLCNERRKKDEKQFAYDELSVSDMKETAKLMTDLLRPGGHGPAFCTTQQLPIWHRLLAAAPLTQHDDSCSSFSSRWKNKLMVGAASLTLADHLFRYPSSPLKRSCALFEEFKFALHLNCIKKLESNNK